VAFTAAAALAAWSFNSLKVADAEEPVDQTPSEEIVTQPE